MKLPYSFSVLRYIHDIVTGEFINVGVGHCHFCGDPLIFARRGMKKGQPEEGDLEVDHIIQKDKVDETAPTTIFLPVSAATASVEWMFLLNHLFKPPVFT